MEGPRCSAAGLWRLWEMLKCHGKRGKFWREVWGALRSQIYKNTKEIKIIDIQIYRSSKSTRIVLPRCKSAVQRHSTRLLALRCTGSASSRRYSVFQEESSGPTVRPLRVWVEILICSKEMNEMQTMNNEPSARHDFQSISEENLIYTEISFTELLQASKQTEHVLVAEILDQVCCGHPAHQCLVNLKQKLGTIPPSQPILYQFIQGTVGIIQINMQMHVHSIQKAISRRPDTVRIHETKVYIWNWKKKVILKNLKNGAWIPNSAAETAPDPSESPRFPMPLTKQISNEAREKEWKRNVFE